MCYEDGLLVAYLDGEVDKPTRESIAAHVRICARCAAALNRLETERTTATDALTTLLAASAQESADAERTWRTYAAAPDRSEQTPAADPPAAGLLHRVGRGRIAVAAAVLAVAASLSFAPVRGFAADLLKVFRIQRVQTITLSDADMEQMSATLSRGEGHLDLKSLGDVWVEGARETTTVTLSQAQQKVGFPIVLPQGLDTEPRLELQPARTIKFKLNVDAVNELLTSYGSSETFPKTIDGKVFSVTMPAAVLATYADDTSGDDAAPYTSARAVVVAAQGRSPELAVPDGVNAAELRDVLISLPIIPESVRKQLSAVTDWEHTLIIPNVRGSARETTIEGVPAVVIAPPKPVDGTTPRTDRPARGAGVIWNQDGVVRGVGGTIDEDAAIRVAKTMIR